MRRVHRLAAPAAGKAESKKLKGTTTMMTFNSLQEAKKYIREMGEEATAEIGDYSVMEYSTGDIELVAPGEEHSDTSDAPLFLGLVRQVLY